MQKNPKTPQCELPELSPLPSFTVYILRVAIHCVLGKRKVLLKTIVEKRILLPGLPKARGRGGGFQLPVYMICAKLQKLNKTS